MRAIIARHDDAVPPPTAVELYRAFKAPLSLDLDTDAKRRRFMVSVGRALEAYGHIPAAAEDVFRRLLAAWESEANPDTDALLDARVEIWQILDAKNAGDSTRIIDEVDRSLRALLCLAEPDDDSSDLWYSAGWAAEMLSSEPWPRAPRLI